MQLLKNVQFLCIFPKIYKKKKKELPFEYIGNIHINIFNQKYSYKYTFANEHES